MKLGKLCSNLDSVNQLAKFIVMLVHGKQNLDTVLFLGQTSFYETWCV